MTLHRIDLEVLMSPESATSAMLLATPGTFSNNPSRSNVWNDHAHVNERVLNTIRAQQPEMHAIIFVHD